MAEESKTQANQADKKDPRPNSKFFDVFREVYASTHRITSDSHAPLAELGRRIDLANLKYLGPRVNITGTDHPPFFGDEAYKYIASHSWEMTSNTRTVTTTRTVITLTDMFGVREDEQFPLVTRINAVELFLKTLSKELMPIASVMQKEYAGETSYHAKQGKYYGGVFHGLNPESGRIRDPRPWLERIVAAYLGELHNSPSLQVVPPANIELCISKKDIKHLG